MDCGGIFGACEFLFDPKLKAGTTEPESFLKLRATSGVHPQIRGCEFLTAKTFNISYNRSKSSNRTNYGSLVNVLNSVISKDYIWTIYKNPLFNIFPSILFFLL